MMIEKTFEMRLIILFYFLYYYPLFFVSYFQSLFYYCVLLYYIIFHHSTFYFIFITVNKQRRQQHRQHNSSTTIKGACIIHHRRCINGSIANWSTCTLLPSHDSDTQIKLEHGRNYTKAPRANSIKPVCKYFVPQRGRERSARERLV